MSERGRTRRRGRHDSPREKRNSSRGRRDATRPQGVKKVAKGDGWRQSTLQQSFGLHHRSTTQNSGGEVEEQSTISTDGEGRGEGQQNTKRSRLDEQEVSTAARRVVRCGGMRIPAFTVITSDAGVCVTGPRLNVGPRPARTVAAEKCTGCGAPEAAFICAECKIAHHCEKLCQKKDWRNHKKCCIQTGKHEECEEVSGLDNSERDETEKAGDEPCEERMAKTGGPQTLSARASGFLIQPAHEETQEDKTRHERRAPCNTLDPRAGENSQDLQRESEHRDALVTILSDARMAGKSERSNSMDGNVEHHHHRLHRIESLKVKKSSGWPEKCKTNKN